MGYGLTPTCNLGLVFPKPSYLLSVNTAGRRRDPLRPQPIHEPSCLTSLSQSTNLSFWNILAGFGEIIAGKNDQV